MAQPTPYNRQYNFTSYAQLHPSDPLPGAQVDIEFNSVKLTLDQALANLALIQKDSGGLRDGIVRQSTLADDLSIGFTFRGEWESGAVYETGDGVSYGLKFYIAEDDHTAASGNRPDLDSATWRVGADFTPVATDAANSLTLYIGTGTGAQTSFNTGVTVAAEQNAMVFVNGARISTDAYSFSGTNVVFSVAPALNAKIEVLIFNSASLTGNLPATSVTLSPSVAGQDNTQSALSTIYTLLVSTASDAAAALAASASVGTSQLQAGSVTTAKIAAGAVGTTELANGSVTVAKMSSGAAASGAVATADGSGGVSYTTPAGAGSKIFLQEISAGSTQNFNFTSFNNTLYDNYEIEFVFTPTGTGTFLKARTSTDAGATYDSGASDYSWLKSQNWAAPAVDATDAFIALSDSMGADDIFGTIKIFGAGSANRKMIHAETTCIVASNAIERYSVSGFRISDTAITAFRLYVDDNSGGAKTIATGKARLYGIKKS